MLDMPWYEDAMGHLFAGFAASMADRTFSQEAGRKTSKRLEEKLESVEALKYLADKEQPEHNQEYFGAVRKARDYFLKTGEIDYRATGSGVVGFKQKVSSTIDHYKNQERVNTLTLKSKLAVAFGFEFAVDSAVFISQITEGVGNGVIALGHSLYQGPAFFAGLLVGRGALYAKDLFRSEDEKELDKLARDLTSDGKLLELVRSYSATTHLQVPSQPELVEGEIVDTESSAPLGRRLGTSVANVLDGASSTISDGIGAIRDHYQEKSTTAQNAEDERLRRIKDRFEKY